MLENNQLGIKPGVYEVFGEIYIVQTITTHHALREDNGWVLLGEPEVIMRKMGPDYEIDEDKKMVHRAYSMPIALFREIAKPL